MKKTVLLVALGVLVIIILTTWSPWTDHTPTQDMTNELRWKAQSEIYRQQVDSLQGKIHDDSVHDAGSTQHAKSRMVSLAQRVDSLRPIPVASDSLATDTVAMVLVRRDDRLWPIPKFVLDLVMDQQTALQKDTVSLNDKDQTIADQRAMLLTQKNRIFSADSTIGVRDLRIRQLTKRRWQDYIAVGCGFGIRGTDCIAGVRVPM